jgi:hypothetical protein
MIWIPSQPNMRAITNAIDARTALLDTGPAEFFVTFDDNFGGERTPYERTATIGEFEISGAYAGEDITDFYWTASPSGDTGAVTYDDGVWEAAVESVGIQTITVTMVHASGTTTETFGEIGFYVPGAHSAFLAQNIDGQYNATLTLDDPIETWVNMGTSEFDLAQGTLANRPLFKTDLFAGGIPTVFFDGADDFLNATTSAVSDWNYLHNGTGSTVHANVRINDSSVAHTIVATHRNVTSQRGYSLYQLTDRRTMSVISDGTGWVTPLTGTNELNLMPRDQWYIPQVQLGSSITPFVHSVSTNGIRRTLLNNTISFSSDDATAVLRCGAMTDGTSPFLGHMASVILYSSVLTDAQLAINRQVDDWSMSHSDITVTVSPVPATVERPLILTGSDCVFEGTYADDTITAMSWLALPFGTTGSVTFADGEWEFALSTAGANKIVITATTPSGPKQIANLATAGFLLPGAHTFFNSQNIDGQWNATLSDNDAVAEWVNFGTSGLNVAQSTPGDRPVYVENEDRGLPTIFSQSIDHTLVAATEAPWTYLHTTDHISTQVCIIRRSGTNGIRNYMGTEGYGAGNGGWRFATNQTTYRARMVINLSTGSMTANLSLDTWVILNQDKFHNGTDYRYGARYGTDGPLGVITFSATTPSGDPPIPLTIGGQDYAYQHVLFYDFAITETQKNANADAARYLLQSAAAGILAKL